MGEKRIAWSECSAVYRGVSLVRSRGRVAELRLFGSSQEKLSCAVSDEILVVGSGYGVKMSARFANDDAEKYILLAGSHPGGWVLEQDIVCPSLDDAVDEFLDIVNDRGLVAGIQGRMDGGMENDRAL